MTDSRKPLGRRAYGSIGHLPGSRLGPGDHHVPPGQADICTVKCRPGDTVFVEEKLDGSCCSVARLDDGRLAALTRAGYLASSSPFEQHWLFAAWVADNGHQFRFLDRGCRVVGEWIAQAHGTIYQTTCPFYVFDIFDDRNRRLTRYEVWCQQLKCSFSIPLCVHQGGAISIEQAFSSLDSHAHSPEGLVYRVEREGNVDFLAKWVRPDKRDGIYLPEVSGCPAVWNWGPKADKEEQP